MFGRIQRLKSDFEDLISVFQYYAENPLKPNDSLAPFISLFKSRFFSNNTSLGNKLKTLKNSLTNSQLLMRIVFNFALFLLQNVSLPYHTNNLQGKFQFAKSLFRFLEKKRLSWEFRLLILLNELSVSKLLRDQTEVTRILKLVCFFVF